MLYLVLLFFMSVEAKFVIVLTDLPLQRIGQRIYKKELLSNQFQDPKELSYDSSSRNLFFMYMDDNVQNSGRAFINVITKEFKKVAGIERNKAVAVDPDTGEVYFGSDDGLYKYDPIDNKAFKIGLYNMNIAKLVIRNNEMYILDANNHMIYKVFGEGSTAVKAIHLKTVMEFQVDNQKNLHVVTMCGVYCVVNGHEIVKNDDLNVVYNFIVDDNKTIGVTENALYDIDCANGTANKIADLDFIPRSMIYGDYGDIYYALDNNIYRLRPVHSYRVYNVHRRT